MRIPIRSALEQGSAFWSVLVITVTTMMVSTVVAEAFAAVMHFHSGWQHYVFALGVPAITTPVWAIPVVRANLQLAQMRGELERVARTDSLSGLPNRRAFFEKARRIIARADDDGSPVAAMMVDVDHFKSINDNFGHDVGDAVIRSIAERIKTTASAMAPCDDVVVARIGGEEFALVLSGINEARAEGLAEAICESVREIECAPGGQPIAMSVSVGVALRLAREPVDRLLKSADRAVYEAKARGRDRSQLAAPLRSSARAA